MNFLMGFIFDGVLSKRYLKMVLKNKIVERCVEKSYCKEKEIFLNVGLNS